MADQGSEKSCEKGGNIGCIDPTSPNNDYNFQKVGHVPSLEHCVSMAPHMGPRCNPDSPETPCYYIGYRCRTDTDYLKELRARQNCDAFLQYFRTLDKKQQEDQIRQATVTSGGDPENFLYGFGGSCASNPAFMEKVRQAAQQPNQPKKDLGGECWVGGESNKNKVFSVPNPEEECKLPIYLVPPKGQKGTDIMQQMMHTMEEEIRKDREQIKQIQDRVHRKEITRNVAARGHNPLLFPLLHMEEQRKDKMERKIAPIRQEVKKAEVVQKDMKQKADMILRLNEANLKNLQISQKQIDKKANLLHKMNADIGTLGWSLRESEKQSKLHNKITTALGILVVLFVALGAGLLLYYLLKYGRGEGAPMFGTVGKSAANQNKGIFAGLFGNTGNTGTTSPATATGDKNLFRGLFGGFHRS